MVKNQPSEPPEPPHRSKAFDSLTAAATVLAIVAGLTSLATSFGWNSPLALVILASAAVLITLVIRLFVKR